MRLAQPREGNQEEGLLTKLAGGFYHFQTLSTEGPEESTFCAKALACELLYPYYKRRARLCTRCSSDTPATHHHLLAQSVNARVVGMKQGKVVASAARLGAPLSAASLRRRAPGRCVCVGRQLLCGAARPSPSDRTLSGVMVCRYPLRLGLTPARQWAGVCDARRRGRLLCSAAAADG